MKYADRWHWSNIINQYDDAITFNEVFLEKFGEYIPASELGRSQLWYNLIEQRIKALKQAILS